MTRIKLGRALERQRRYREAETQLRQGCALVRKSWSLGGMDHRRPTVRHRPCICYSIYYTGYVWGSFSSCGGFPIRLAPTVRFANS